MNVSCGYKAEFTKSEMSPGVAMNPPHITIIPAVVPEPEPTPTPEPTPEPESDVEEVAFHAAAELILNIDLHRAVSSDIIDTEGVRTLVDTARSWRVDIDAEGINYDLQENLEKMMACLVNTPEESSVLKSMIDCIGLAQAEPFAVDLWQVQNLYWEMLQNIYPEFKQRAEQGDRQAAQWLVDFISLGKLLKIKVS